jgi:hypothetical protein
MRRSTKVGVYLYLASTRKLTSEQKAFLAHTQGKLNYDELNRALRIYSDLCSDQRLRARLGVENTTVPALPPPRRPKEQRRIGIGYRDKGSLRPPHRPSLPGEDTISTDQEELLRSTFQDPPLPEAGERMTADDWSSAFARSRPATSRQPDYPEGGYRLEASENPEKLTHEDLNRRAGYHYNPERRSWDYHSPYGLSEETRSSLFQALMGQFRDDPST